VKAGASLKMPLPDMLWGDRFCVMVHPFGNNWSIAKRQRDMTATEFR
jgi:uncharacterized glyoxalase superfamily protein PhnB